MEMRSWEVIYRPLGTIFWIGVGREKWHGRMKLCTKHKQQNKSQVYSSLCFWYSLMIHSVIHLFLGKAFLVLYKREKFWHKILVLGEKIGTKCHTTRTRIMIILWQIVEIQDQQQINNWRLMCSMVQVKQGY